MTCLFTDIDYAVGKIPERQLLAAILLRTWSDLDAIDKIIRNTSFYWLDLEETADWSFPWICEQLDLNAKQVKRSMLTTPYYEAVQKVTASRYGKVKKSWLCDFL